MLAVWNNIYLLYYLYYVHAHNLPIKCFKLYELENWYFVFYIVFKKSLNIKYEIKLQSIHDRYLHIIIKLKIYKWPAYTHKRTDRPPHALHPKCFVWWNKYLPRVNLLLTVESRRIFIPDLKYLCHIDLVSLDGAHVHGEPAAPIFLVQLEEVGLSMDEFEHKWGADGKAVREIGLLINGKGDEVWNTWLFNQLCHFFKFKRRIVL